MFWADEANENTPSLIFKFLHSKFNLLLQHKPMNKAPPIPQRVPHLPHIQPNTRIDSGEYLPRLAARLRDTLRARSPHLVVHLQRARDLRWRSDSGEEAPEDNGVLERHCCAAALPGCHCVCGVAGDADAVFSVCGGGEVLVCCVGGGGSLVEEQL
jgi:hypothetical protein